MILALHETCLEYFKRRLSEGWRCVSLEGYNAVLLSPDGIRRELDLRNAVETLRPNDNGDYKELNLCIGCPDATHWECSDEASCDGDSSFAGNSDVSGYLSDAYHLAASAIPGGSIINSVTVYTCHNGTSGTGKYRPGLRLAVVETLGTEIASTPSWLTHSEALARPGGGNWAVADLADLQVIAGCRNTTTPSASNVSQIYIEVDWSEAPSGIENKSANMGAKMLAEKML